MRRLSLNARLALDADASDEVQAVLLHITQPIMSDRMTGNLIEVMAA